MVKVIALESFVYGHVNRRLSLREQFLSLPIDVDSVRDIEVQRNDTMALISYVFVVDN